MDGNNADAIMRAALREAKIRIAELEQQVTALKSQLVDRVESLPNLLPKFYRRDEIPLFDGLGEIPVDLVLTVKNTYDLLVPCLESVFRNTNIPFRLFLNDNASDDPRTPALLRKILDEHPDTVQLFLQESDLGFTDAANLLLRQTKNDVILINADTTMPPGWAPRLLWPIRHSGEKVATCTPLTNAGTLASFPRLHIDQELFDGMEPERLDSVFQHAKAEYFGKMPTGVGFCMAISRTALDEVGLLDADTFRPGYGEETDWCCRAASLGYINALVSNLFIYHKHGGTTTRDSSRDWPEYRHRHAAIIAKRYPYLEDRYLAFADDPTVQAFRSFLVFLAAVESGGGLGVTIVDYPRLTERELSRPPSFPADRPLVLVGRHPDSGEYILCFVYKEYSGHFTSPDYRWIMKALHRVKVAEILMTDIPVDKDRDRLLRALERLGERTGAKMALQNKSQI